MITFKRIDDICSNFNTKKILIYGDIILDRYIFGQVRRISPEAPVPILKIQKEEFRPGGAGNVAANIDKLEARGLLMGITGQDMYAEEISKLKPNDNLTVPSHQNKTIVKTRVISQRQQIVRIDREKEITLTPELENQVIQKINKLECDGIIISDYAKGTLTSPIMETLKTKAHTHNIPIIADPKPPNFSLYKNISGITPNLIEAESIINKKITSDSDAAAAAKQIRIKYNTQFALITRGRYGITAAERNKKVFHLPAFSHEVFDVTGAGDTVVSVLLLSLVSGATLREAVSLSNAAASIVIEKVGTSNVTIEEILERMKFLQKRKLMHS